MQKLEKAWELITGMRLKETGAPADIAIYGISAHACSAWRVMGEV